MEENNNKSTTNYIISGVLAVAVIVLFVLFFTQKPGGAPSTPPTQTHLITLDDGTVVEQELPLLPIAYIQSDSIYSTYKFFTDQSEALQSKYSSELTNLQSRERKIQEDYARLQQDAQNNRYLSREEQEQRLVSIERRMEELQRNKMQADQNTEYQVYSLKIQLADSIKNAIDILNTDKKYQMVFLNEGLSTILYAEDAYDLTQELLDLLNARYKPENK